MSERQDDRAQEEYGDQDQGSHGNRRQRTDVADADSGAPPGRCDHDHDPEREEVDDAERERVLAVGSRGGIQQHGRESDPSLQHQDQGHQTEGLEKGGKGSRGRCADAIGLPGVIRKPPGLSERPGVRVCLRFPSRMAKPETPRVLVAAHADGAGTNEEPAIHGLPHDGKVV